MPLFWFSLTFVAGLVLSAYAALPGAGWLGASGGALLLWLLLRRITAQQASRGGVPDGLRWAAVRHPRLGLPPLLLIAALCGGAAYYRLSLPDLANGHVAAYNDQGRVQIQAVVIEPPDLRDQTTHLRLRVERVTRLGEDGYPGTSQPASGLVHIILRGRAGWQYGDRLLLTGKLETPPEDEEFSYRAYLARQNVYSYLPYPTVRRMESGAGSPLMAAILRFRGWAYAEINHLYPAPESALLAGILLGMENDLPGSTARAFQDTGTAHIIAISGFNIAILAELFSKLFSRILTRWWALVMAILGVCLYTALVGGSPSVVRAAIMGSLSLIAAQIGRRSTAVNSLAFAAAVMCLFDPHLPWDASFQLSFGATLGLILYADPLLAWFTGLLERRLPSQRARQIARPVGDYFLFTLAAQAATLPVVLFHFQRLSLSALLANPLILPPQPLVMVLSGIAVLVGLVSDTLAHLLANLALPAATYTIRMVELLARIPGGVLAVPELDFAAAALLAFIVFCPAIGMRLPRLKSLTGPLPLLSAALLTAVSLTQGLMARPDGALRLTIHNLDGSQVMLVRAPAGETLLIGGGARPSQLNDLLGRWLPPYGDTLDALLINDPGASRISALPAILDRYPPEQTFLGTAPPTHRTGKDLLEELQGHNSRVHVLSVGEAILMGEEVRLKASVVTEGGSALLLTWGSFRALIPGGVAVEAIPPDDLSGLSVLVLEERDLEQAGKEAWERYAPRATVVTQNGSALPVEGVNWLNVCPEGWLAVTTDGERMWLEISN